ncbi:hypothetical protein [Methylobacter sp.]|uniref:hypothetical protein n=1 Tax=Methylobacter sp. TaxID=2051955 RepID=UPI002FDD61CE
MYGSILNYGNYRYLKQAAALALIALLLYFSSLSDEPPNGGTWQGYTLGVIGAALILILLWFGIRKRQYHCTKNSLARWASAHVYLGISLPVAVTLHCGFQFGWNVHTLAYTLMMLVVVSGFYGLYAYLVYPEALTANRNGVSRREMIADIAKLNDTGLTLAEDLSTEAYHLVLREVEETHLGGTLWHQITMNSGLPAMPLLQWKLAGNFVASEQASSSVTTLSPEDFLRKYFRKSESTAEIHRVVELLKVLNERQSMVNRVQLDIRYHAFMKCWLFLHVPLSCALLAAVLVHVVSVFFYW